MLVKRFLSALLLVSTLSLLGCQPEEKIVQRSVPRLNDMQRLLVAFLPPVKDGAAKSWTFKVIGKESEIEPLVQPFHDFIRTLNFNRPEGRPLWLLTPGWSVEGDTEKMFTIHMGPEGKAPKMTVSFRRGDVAASILENMRRWRAQLGLKDNLGSADLMDLVTPTTIDGRPAYLVDLVGPGGRADIPPIDDEPELPFHYEAPGWRPIPPTDKLYVLSFLAEDKDQRASINVSVFPGDGGGIFENVNRWHGQLKLRPMTPAEVAALPDVAIGNAKGKLVDITGPDARPDRNRIVGAILLRKQDSLFFKMTGPAELVGKEKPAFESFLKSVNFMDEG